MDRLTLAEAARIVREATRDKSYQLTPIGAEVAAYMRHKRKRLTDASERGYESFLDKLARDFADFDKLAQFEPPDGTRLIEDFLDKRWGELAPGTYNVALSIVRDFFKWACARGYMRGNPTDAIERAKARQPHRTTFSADDRRRIVADRSAAPVRLRATQGRLAANPVPPLRSCPQAPDDLHEGRQGPRRADPGCRVLG